MRVMVKVSNLKVIPKLMRYGNLLSKFNLINVVEIETEEENLDKIKNLEEVEGVKIYKKLRLLRE